MGPVSLCGAGAFALPPYPWERGFVREAGNARDLVRRSSCVVLGDLDGGVRRYALPHRIAGRRLVVSEQPLYLRRCLFSADEGPLPSVLALFSPGLEPRPPAEDPLTPRFPGPFAPGRYVFFLRRLPPRRDACTLVGGWQGLYPVVCGRTVALEGYGFCEFDGKTIDELAAVLRSLIAS
ncbi:hypothetical protein [Brockia lithotrophica]|uniref:Uncharacterized protein n=1 Tax=Brockia lithotrophica TaxID=933949 RepID=A0A660L4L5_9BACL|nr:hypothetical protein [Brockia lithotrophica]RKQ88866.1 hypothetical protein C7438_0514 [Brockia lithotrophica]